MAAAFREAFVTGLGWNERKQAMNIWLLKTDYYSGAVGGILWSETTKPREVDPSPRWYSTESDVVDRFGPYSEDLRAQVAKYWCLFDRPRNDLTPTVSSIGRVSFTGAPFGTKAVAVCFAEHGGGEVELLQVPQIWSQPDEAPVEIPYFIANVYGLAPTIDIMQSSLMKIPNPRHGNPYILKGTRPQDAVVYPNAQGHRHVWRDAATGQLFCDDIFRAAITDVAPNCFEFNETTPVGE